MKNLDEINRLIAAAEAELAEPESSRSKLLSRVAELQHEIAALLQPSTPPDLNDKLTVTNNQTKLDQESFSFKN